MSNEHTTGALDTGYTAPAPGERGEAWRATLRAELEQRRRAVFAQIAAYPTPITGCDQQFNHLLLRREGFTAALAGLDAAGDDAAAEAALAHLEPADREGLPQRPR